MTDNRTTELRAKLTERGVEFATDDSAASKVTMWTTQNGCWMFDCDYMEPLNEKPGTIGAKTELMIYGYTPEQAIAATLGNERATHGTLTAEQVREAIEKRFDFDVWVPKERWQAIADELNAELGSDDEYEAKMDALLCRLTNGKWSKSRSYDLDFMVSCIEEEFEAAELENGTYERIAELEQLIRNMYHEHPIYYFEQWMEDHGIEVER